MSELAWRDMGGSGRPFVLVHGYTGSSDDFAHVVEPLTDLRRIILVDLPGHGTSPRSEHYSLNAMTAAAGDFLETVVAEPCDLLGHSMGGRVVLPIAIDGSALLRSLVLMDTWADTPDGEERSHEMEALLALPDAEAVATWERRPAEPPTAETDLIVARWGQDWLDEHSVFNNQVDPLAVVQLAREFRDDPNSLLAATRSIHCPTTVLVGEFDDPFVGPSRRMAATIPDAELVMIVRAYHSPQLTHAEEWCSALRRHLERADAASA
jgi:pimeloyl-ACP methyl ester carboxylesterase